VNHWAIVSANRVFAGSPSEGFITKTRAGHPLWGPSPRLDQRLLRLIFGENPLVAHGPTLVSARACHSFKVCAIAWEANGRRRSGRIRTIDQAPIGSGEVLDDGPSGYASAGRGGVTHRPAVANVQAG
jgi:hypothetical protein